MPEQDELLERIEELESELEDLRPLAAAAKEAYAFLSGRRPGFAPSYPYDVLRSAIEPEKPRKRRKPPTGRPARAGRRAG
jgi:hypothetical protein